MILHLLSSDFRNTPIEAREKIHVDKSKYSEVHDLLQNKFRLDDIVIVSTCNRLELYLLSKQTEIDRESLIETLLKAMNVDSDNRIRFNHKKGDEAVRHLFRVASGLESLVIGEPQILGQLKEAFEEADKKRKIGGYLRLIYEKAFSTAKKINNETNIRKNAISISSTAVKLAEKVFSGLDNRTVMVIGAGEMAELVLHSLKRFENLNILVVNRTFQTAVKLADEFGGSALGFDSLKKNLHLADLVISSTGSQNSILDKKAVAEAMIRRKYEPVFLIDIALPRDIEPDVHSLDNVYLYDIDDLKNVAAENLKERKEAAEKADLIIGQELEKLNALLRLRSHAKIITLFREEFLNSMLAGASETIKKMKTPAENDREKLIRSLELWAKQQLHAPTLLLREKISEGDVFFLDHFCSIFNINLELKETTDDKSKIIQFHAKQN